MYKYRNQWAITLFTGILSFFYLNSSIWAGEINGVITGESWLFLQESLYDDQGNSNVSLSGELEYFQDWDNGNQSLLFVPYFRYDSEDEERTHTDIRELYWVTVHPDWELYIGVRKIFWGVTESQHLVDIVNQTDLVDNPSGEEKLGQPMANLSIVNDLGTFDFFVLTGFRERTFPGEDSRFRFPLKVDIDHPVYESEEENQHIDFAARSFHTIDDLEIGFSLFSGINRTPDLLSGVQDDEFVLVPHYGIIQQAGLELQWLIEDWILKWESITRQQNEIESFSVTTGAEYTSSPTRYTAYTTGFEYTWSNMKESGIDWGVLLEYLYDDRGRGATTPFEQDVFVASRVTLNDVQSSDFLLGVIIDPSNNTKFWNVSGSRRLGENMKVTVEGQLFGDVDEEDLLFSQRKNDYLKLELAYYF